jgi:hypothetical protein
MPHNLTVQVVSSNGKPRHGVRVEILIKGFFSGGSLESFTDKKGLAKFVTDGNYERSRKLNISVRKQSFGPFDIGGGSYTVQID